MHKLETFNPFYLDIIVENKMRWAVFFQQIKCIMIGEILKLKKNQQN